MDYKSRPLSKYNKDLSDFLDNVPNSDNIKRMLFDDDKDLGSFRRNGFGTMRPRTYFDTNSFFDRARDDAKHSSFDDNFKMFKTDPLRMHKSTWSAPTTPQHVVAGSSSNSAPSTPPIIPSGSGTASPLATHHHEKTKRNLILPLITYKVFNRI
uniref:Uncharacterized protein n=1 Tax=Megaselia scalaris TaxID=36166 RepID=T1H5I4_MEGSC